MQSVFQKYTDNAVSKTINLPKNSKISDVKKIYELALKLKCKGITVYRYGSKSQQVLYIGGVEKKKKMKLSKFISAEAEYAGGCATGVCPL
jgi:ribonucleoside-diphosphate reductase alpha chain